MTVHLKHDCLLAEVVKQAGLTPLMYAELEPRGCVVERERDMCCAPPSSSPLLLAVFVQARKVVSSFEWDLTATRWEKPARTSSDNPDSDLRPVNLS